MILLKYIKQYHWWGKLIGVFLGFLIAGPSGALLGLFIGNLFDRGLSEHLTRPNAAYHAETRLAVKQTFQRSTFLVMGHLCKSDGRVSEQEILFVKNTMRHLRLSQSDRKIAEKFFTQGKAKTFNIDEPLNLLCNIASDNKQLLQEFVQLQYQAARVDGLTIEKTRIINRILNTLGLAPLHEQSHFHDHVFYYQSQQQNNWKQHQNSWQHDDNRSSASRLSLTEAYAQLHVKEASTHSEVKRAYRRQISQYHPDKYIAKKRSEIEIKQANEKTQAVRKAYETICQAKGWPY